VLLALGVLALALTAAATALALRRSGEEQRRIADLDARLAIAERDLIALQNDVEARRIDVEDLPALGERLERLESAVARTGALASGKSAASLAVAEATRTVLDGASPVHARLAALRELGGQRLADGTDARLPVLPTAIELAQTSKDADVRAGIWRALCDLPEPALLAPLLHALATDETPRVREEAAQALTAFMPAPDVRSALRGAAELDTDEHVRRQARKSLNDWVR
jgi:hypothetical protein